MVVLDLESVPSLDVSAARMLATVAEDLRRDGVEVRLARVVGQVHDVLDTTLAAPPPVGRTEVGWWGTNWGTKLHVVQPISTESDFYKTL